MIVVIAAITLRSQRRVMNRTFHLTTAVVFIHRAVRIIVLATLAILLVGLLAATVARAECGPLKAPEKEQIPVAFLISDGAQVIDFCGPWEVFQDTVIPSRTDMPFRLYTVAETTKPIRTTGGMQVVPDYSIADAPAAKVIVIPAQSDPSPAVLDWIKMSSKTTDVTMSVCTGAFVLAKTGLLSGKSATTYHGAFSRFAMTFPDIHLKRGARFVENGNLATAGGLSSGINLALRVVERYYGREVAQKTAYNMEYQGQGWMNAESNELYAKALVSTREHPLCAICSMDVDPKIAPKSTFNGATYYFCSTDEKKMFDAAPDKFVSHSAQ